MILVIFSTISARSRQFQRDVGNFGEISASFFLILARCLCLFNITARSQQSWLDSCQSTWWDVGNLGKMFGSFQIVVRSHQALENTNITVRSPRNLGNLGEISSFLARCKQSHQDLEQQTSRQDLGEILSISVRLLRSQQKLCVDCHVTMWDELSTLHWGRVSFVYCLLFSCFKYRWISSAEALKRQKPLQMR